MLMLDVRNAIAKILDRYTLAEIVEITLRKLRRDKVTPAFSGTINSARASAAARSKAASREQAKIGVI